MRLPSNTHNFCFVDSQHVQNKDEVLITEQRQVPELVGCLTALDLFVTLFWLHYYIILDINFAIKLVSNFMGKI